MGETPNRPAGGKGSGGEDTLPATRLAAAVGAADLGSAETVQTPRSNRPGSKVASGGAPGGDIAPGAGGHEETISDHSHPQLLSPGGGVDQVRVTAGTLLGKRYRIGEHLGSGGMGTVYAAQDLLVDQAVALKFVRPSLASDHRERERLRHEVRLAQSVTHVNVARTYTLDEIDGHLFIVMELLRGQTLSALLRNGALGIEETLRIADGLLQGLSAAHVRGILHRDIKPANIKIGEDGRAVIMDFGMARTSESAQPAVPMPIEYSKLKVQITHTMLGGTPGYIAPEILRGRRGDVRADLYSFGVMLFEMLVGRAPFASATPLELLLKHLEDKPPLVDELRADVPPHVAQMVARLLAKEPDERPQSAEAVRRDLLGMAGGDTPSGAGGARATPRITGDPAAATGLPTEPNVPTPRSTDRVAAVALDPRSPPLASDVSPRPRRRAGLWVVGGLVVAGGAGFAIWQGTATPRANPVVPVVPVVAPPDAAVPRAVGALVLDAGPAGAVQAADAGVTSTKPGSKRKNPRAPTETRDPREPKPNEPAKPDAAEKRRRQLELED